MTIFAANPNDILLPMLLGSLAVVAIGLFLGSLLNAVWLRLASAWLRIGEFGFDKAFGTAFMSTFVFAALAYALALAIWLGMRSQDPTSFRVNLMFFLSPTNIIQF